MRREDSQPDQDVPDQDVPGKMERSDFPGLEIYSQAAGPPVRAAGAFWESDRAYCS